MSNLDEITRELRGMGYPELALRVQRESEARASLLAKLDKAEQRARKFEGWWAGLQVDSERKIREASARALDCADHGRIIREAESQVAHLDRQYREADSKRGRYGVFLLQLRDSLERVEPHATTAGKLRDAMVREIRKVLR